MRTINKKITTAMLLDACERQMFGCENPGFCIECGEEVSGFEPDAAECECECCGAHAVYGAEFLLMSTV